MRVSMWMLAASTLISFVGCRYLERSERRLSSSDAAPPPSALSPILALGQSAELPSYRIKLVSQRDCGSNAGERPQAGNRSWAVELEITNISSHKVAASPFYATLQDDQRNSYKTSLAGCPPLLAAKLLEPQETIRGYVPFELPRATPNVTLSYRPVLRGNVEYVARFGIEL